MTTSKTEGASRGASKTKLPDNDETREKLGRYGEVMFSEAETATAMNSTLKDLTALFSKSKEARRAFEGGRLRTLEALRRAQFKHAQTNASMAMFLGRTYLGQAEQREGADGQAPAFDLNAATQRLRDKLAPYIVAPAAPGDREGA